MINRTTRGLGIVSGLVVAVLGTGCIPGGINPNGPAIGGVVLDFAEIAARGEQERKAREAKLRQLPENVISRDGKFYPAPGYMFANNTPGDLTVTKLPEGMIIEDGKFRPAPGYALIQTDPDKLAAVRVPENTVIENGRIRPIEGYEFISNTRGDYRVKKIVPMTERPSYAALLNIAKKDGIYMALWTDKNKDDVFNYSDNPNDHELMESDSFYRGEILVSHSHLPKGLSPLEIAVSDDEGNKIAILDVRLKSRDKYQGEDFGMFNFRVDDILKSYSEVRQVPAPTGKKKFKLQLSDGDREVYSKDFTVNCDRARN